MRGAQFDQLDPAVQEEFERFLGERGVDEALALFVPDYAEYKEQKVRLRPSSRYRLCRSLMLLCLAGVCPLARECEELRREVRYGRCGVTWRRGATDTGCP